MRSPKFRRFSRSISKSQSMALLLMIEFFEMNGISANEVMGPKMKTLESLIKKRVNGGYFDSEKYREKPNHAIHF